LSCRLEPSKIGRKRKGKGRDAPVLAADHRFACSRVLRHRKKKEKEKKEEKVSILLRKGRKEGAKGYQVLS